MIRRMMVLLPAVLLAAASCGMSSTGTDGDDPGKTELEIRMVSASPTDTSAVISWTTTDQTVGTVQYGREKTALTRSVSSRLASQHEAVLPNLEADTEYWYQISAASPLGPRLATEPASFRTLVNPDIHDTTAPVIYAIEVIGITPGSATVTWSTDDRTVGVVSYGFSTMYELGSVQTNQQSYTRSHAVTLTDLEESEVYHFRIQAKNYASLTSYSDDDTFRTTELPYLEIDPETIHVIDGNTFEFALVIRNASNLAGLSFLLSYEPSVMSLISVRPGDFWSANRGNAGLWLLERDDSRNGLVQYSASWEIQFQGDVPTGTLANGGGEIALFRARANGSGTNSPLRLIVDDLDGDGKAETRLLDHNRQELMFHVRNSVVLKQE